MRIFYTIGQALEYLKDRIQEEEIQLKRPGRSAWEKESSRHLIQDYFERAIAILQFAKPQEIDPDLLDWFFDRKEFEDRPDILKLKQKLDKELELDKEEE